MSDTLSCPRCESVFVYPDGNLFICPECTYEFSTSDFEVEKFIVRDNNGNKLSDGDTISIIQDLKLKGLSTVIKVGTKIKNIRLASGEHNIDCKIKGVGEISLKSELVKKI